MSTDLSVEQLVSRIRKLAKGRSEAQILTTQMDCVTLWDASPKWAQMLSTNLNAEQLASRIRKLAKGRSDAQTLTTRIHCATPSDVSQKWTQTLKFADII